MASNLFEAQVLKVHHWTDTLFSLVTTRDTGFRFDSGQFTMMGLMVEGRPLLRAYSMASAPYDDHLEFLSIKVQQGKLTSRLQHLREGDIIHVARKPSGTLVSHHLQAGGRNLYLLATGTGLAPFLSLIQDHQLYEQFDRIVLTHTCRTVAELAYREFITRDLPANELIGDEVRRKLTYYPTVTREPFQTRGRITDLIRSGQLFRDVGLPAPSTEADRFMICGSPQMLADTRALLEELGFQRGLPGEPGQYVFETAFVG